MSGFTPTSSSRTQANTLKECDEYCLISSSDKSGCTFLAAFLRRVAIIPFERYRMLPFPSNVAVIGIGKSSGCPIAMESLFW